MNCEYVKHTKISYEEIYDDRFFHSYFYSYREVDCPDSWILNPYKNKSALLSPFEIRL